ncbi:TRAP transporter large permease [Arsenicitalea aurantiaca]|uniref:TRAP transporter large permease protein n=1 Tax=Arsenicitalea aurantiaca TaxID=1783274 RepID=A0A433XEF9_9HYPH|nr:TRAP transporter large permease [Arsenicitalea aurantiaca]RUT32485.1 TRAP transporter large permease [Arsenicitalea aurantiaca]
MIVAVLVIFAVLSMLSVPIAIATGIAVALGLVFFGSFPPELMFQKMVTGIDNFTLVAIPLFVLTGNLMNSGGITERIFTFVRKCLGHRNGGLAHANVGASVLFAGMSGSAVADAAGLGAVEIKAMRDQGYDVGFSAGITAASSVIGPIIPPSIPLVIYGAIAQVSVGQLFVAGLVPGLLLALSLSMMIVWMGRGGRFPREPRANYRERFSALGRAGLSLATPAIILVGLIGGVFTPTEAGAVAALYALVISLVVYRTIRLRDLPKIFIETMITTAIVTFIISNVSAFSWILAVSQAGSAFVEGVRGLTDNPIIVLLIINLCLLVLGCLIEAGAVLIIMTPILLPLAVSVGVDPLHFGIIIVLNLMIGVATPPVGMSLFVTAHVAGIPIEKMMRAILPFLVPLFAALLVVTYVPEVVMFLPRLLFP